MRIPLSVEKFYGDRKLVFANIFIQIPRFRVAHGLSSAVDSGSPFTTISTRDALAFHLPISNWKGGEQTGLAGLKWLGHWVDAILTFRDDQGNPVKFNTQVRVLVPTKFDAKTLSEIKNIPSLIGTDFLEDHDITFIYKPNALTAYFEWTPPQPVAPI